MAVSNKTLKKAVQTLGLGAITIGAVAPALATVSVNADTDNKQEQSAKVAQADYTKLDKSTADAKKAKISVNERQTKRAFATQAEAVAFVKEEQARADKQAAANQKKIDTYNKELAEYNKAVAPFKGQTPKIDKDGLKVYGEFNEAHRGSTDYYKDFNAIVDPETFDKGGYSLLDTIQVSDKTKFIGLGKTKVVKSDVEDYNNPMQIIKPQKGDSFKATNMSTDMLTGNPVDVIFDMTSQVKPGDGSDWRMLLTQNRGALGIGYVKVSGLSYDIKFVDQVTGKQLKIYTVFGNVDVDNHQGGDMTFGNIGYLNPSDSGVSVTQNANGVSYFDTTGNTLNEDKDIPFGSFMVAGHGNTFSASFYDNYADNKGDFYASAKYGGQASGAGFYNEMFGSAGAMKMIVPPEKPKLVVDKVDVSVTAGPIKSHVDTNGNILTDNNVKLGDHVNFGLSATIPEVDSKGNPTKDVTIVDPLEDVFKFESGVVKLNDAKGEDITADGTLAYVDGTGVVWTPKDGSKYAGKTVYIQLDVSIKPDADLTKYEKDGQLVFPNSVYMTVNGEKIPGNEVTVVPVGETTPIVKKVVVENWDKVLADTEVKSETVTTDDKENKSDDTEKVATVKKGQSFGYVLNTKIDTVNEKGQLIKSFKLVDKLEDALTVDKVRVIDKTTGQDITADFEQSGKLEMTLKSDKLVDYRGHDVEWRIGVHIDEDADLKSYKQEDGTYLVANVGSKEQNDTPTESNKVDVKLDKDPEPKPTPDPKKPEPKPEPQLPNTGGKVNAWTVGGLIAGLASAVGGYVYFKKRG